MGSARQGNRRVIFVISGLNSAQARAEVSEQIVNWAFRQFGESTLARKGERVATADVWMGSAPRVGLVPADDVTVLLPLLTDADLKAEVVYNGPIQAPITKDQVLAELVMVPEGLPEIRIPLVAEQDVPEGGFMVRMRTAISVLMQSSGMPSGETS